MGQTAAPARALRFGLMYLQVTPFVDVVDRVRRGEEVGWARSRMLRVERWFLVTASEGRRSVRGVNLLMAGRPMRTASPIADASI